MMRPIIRLAEDNEGEDIRQILASWGLIPNGLDWSKVKPCWLVAEYKKEIVGCCQIIIGYPLGHIGFWAVAKKWHNFGFGIPLWRTAEKMLAQSGCDGYTSLTDYPPILKRLEKHGAIIFGPKVNWLFKRVRRRPEVKDEVLQQTGT